MDRFASIWKQGREDVVGAGCGFADDDGVLGSLFGALVATDFGSSLVATRVSPVGGVAVTAGDVMTGGEGGGTHGTIFARTSAPKEGSGISSVICSRISFPLVVSPLEQALLNDSTRGSSALRYSAPIMLNVWALLASLKEAI
jgi:hypothetical protein